MGGLKPGARSALKKRVMVATRGACASGDGSAKTARTGRALRWHNAQAAQLPQSVSTALASTVAGGMGVAAILPWQSDVAAGEAVDCKDWVFTSKVAIALLLSAEAAIETVASEALLSALSGALVKGCPSICTAIASAANTRKGRSTMRKTRNQRRIVK